MKKYIFEKINNIELEVLDGTMYAISLNKIVVFDETALDTIKEQYKEYIEKETGLKVVYAKYQLCPAIESNKYKNLLSRYYLVRE